MECVDARLDQASSEAAPRLRRFFFGKSTLTLIAGTRKRLLKSNVDSFIINH
jgi:hypothetical protein